VEGPFAVEVLVDRNRFFFVEAARLVVPVGAERAKVRFNGACVVGAEEKLTAGGSEDNADICLSSATVTPVSGSECAVRNCCGHVRPP